MLARADILCLILKSWLERKAARREHSRVINGFREQSLKGSGRHGMDRTVRSHLSRVKSQLVDNQMISLDFLPKCCRNFGF